MAQRAGLPAPTEEPRLSPVHMLWSEKPCNMNCWNGGFEFQDAIGSDEVEFFVTNHQWMENDSLFVDLALPVAICVEDDDTMGASMTVGMRGFYEDPEKFPLDTPSGKLGFYSQALADNFPDDKERQPIAIGDVCTTSGVCGGEGRDGGGGQAFSVGAPRSRPVLSCRKERKMKELLEKYGVKQLGFHVKSIEESAELFAKLLGAGPFVDLGVFEPASLTYRGKDSGMRSRSALGHVKDIQIELIEVTTDEPDVYKENGFGLHHVCVWSDDVDAVAREFASAGAEDAMEVVSGQGLQVVYLDAREQLGFFVECNAPIEQLWQGIRALHENAGEGTPALLPMAALMGGK